MRDSTKEEAVGKFGNAGGTPSVFLFETRTEGGLSKLPNGEVEGEGRDDERGEGVSDKKEKESGRRWAEGEEEEEEGKREEKEERRLSLEKKSLRAE